MTDFLKLIPDPRQYSIPSVKNIILFQIEQIIKSAPEEKLALEKGLEKTISQYLLERNSLPISVALSMVPDQTYYKILWKSLNNVLSAQEYVFVLLPVVLVVGTKTEQSIVNALPHDLINKILLEYKIIEQEGIVWSDFWLNSQQISSLKLEEWFYAGQNKEDSFELLNRFSSEDIVIDSGQQVKVLFAFGVVKDKLKLKLNESTKDFCMPLMLALNEYFSNIENITVFANPLVLQEPLNALANAAKEKQMMDLEVFASNAIRTIRLRNLDVGAICLAQSPNQLKFSFSSVLDNESVGIFDFLWVLSSLDEIEKILNYFVGLMRDCQVKHVVYFSKVFSEDVGYFSFSQTKQAGAQELCYE